MSQFDISQRLRAAQRRFAEFYGSGATHVLSAPARINILGEHIDYVSYVPTASLTFGSHQHAMLMLYRPNAEAKARGASTNAAYPPFGLCLQADDLAGTRTWESYVFERAAPAPHWRNYVEGAVRYAQWQHGERIQQGIDFLVDSTIPACGGSSSSSALTCLSGAALRAVNGVSISNHELALASSQAEWFIGTRGGAMDHLTICLSRPGAAVLIHHDTQTTEYVSLPATGYAWVTFFSHEADKGSRVMLEYNARAAVSRIVIPALLAGACVIPPSGGSVRGQEIPPEGGTTNALPEFITLDEFAQRDAMAYAECARLFPQLGQHDLLKVRAYAEHHLGEARRVRQALAWLRAEAAVSDDTMRKLGGLLNETHLSLRDLYEISTPEVENLRELILRDVSVYGARLMGGGFGGNVLALTRAEAVTALIERVQREFYAPRHRNGLAEGAVMVSLPGSSLQAAQLNAD